MIMLANPHRQCSDVASGETTTATWLALGCQR